MHTRLRLSKGYALCHTAYANEAWHDFYERVINDQVQHVQQLKHDGTTTVYRADIQQTECVVKRYNTKNTWHFIRRALRQSRAMNCWEMAQDYLAAGIQTPQPIAMIQARNGLFKRRSWYICTHQSGQTLSDTVAHRPDPKKLHIWPSQMAQLFRTMLDNRLSHGDFKATNLITHDDQIVLIDLDAARSHPSSARHLKILTKDYHRFMQNWADDPIALTHFRAALQPIEWALPKNTTGEHHEEKDTPD